MVLPAAFNGMEAEPPVDRDFERLSMRPTKTVSNVDSKNCAGQKASWMETLAQQAIGDQRRGGEVTAVKPLKITRIAST